ncbi:SET domain-containing protein-lysine N-methyltransferase [Campylobacter concisus]|uniref:SET domain-containing protein-lysine N-methyltransferase n=1 Tax=Campylobacter concisus TaxID=199 RepID=UPI0015E15F05|nr:SET domain-containing protein [Campylobacter concisus]MDU2009698.1 SET domain-containing protein [Campylobacter concisus]
MSEKDTDVTKNIDFINETIINNINFTYIAESKIHGFGLFANKNLDSGTILCFLDGQVMSWDHYDEIAKSINLGKYQNYIFMEWNALSNKTLLVRAFRTKYSYINHSSVPNVEIKYNPIRIETIKQINKNDEIVIDYNKEPLKKEYLDDKEKGFL